MCGICGIITADSTGIEPAVRRMMHALIHRGPDDEGYEQFPFGAGVAASAGFGFRRLAILDLSPLGHQPMVDATTGNAIAFNGEIYNFRSLRSRLEAEGHAFRSTGDTEVLLRALSAWGERALAELDGMFAVAFYHAATRRVLLARDPLGIKPLYLAQAPGRVVFASEVRAVLASGLVSDELDPAGIASFLAYGAPQDPLTVHRAVRSLPAGSHAWIDAETLVAARTRPHRYWQFPRIAPPGQGADEVVARIAAELDDSVRRQCIADVPLAVFLSGGIDSAAMAALARPAAGPVRTFAVGYDVPGSPDETAAAADTARALGTQHFQTIVDDDWVMLQLFQWFKAADRPSIDGLNTYIISGAIRDRDITVALSGLGADELFGGYDSFRRVPKLRRWLAAIAWLPAAWRRAAVRRLLWRLPTVKRAKLADLLGADADAITMTVSLRRLMDDDTLRGLGFDARTLGLTPQFLPAQACAALDMKTGDDFAAVSRAELALYMGNTLLRDSDVNSMAHSLELRVPFLGQRVVDFVAGLPQGSRSPPNSLPKHLLRRALADRLPAAVFNRPKTGFTLPFAAWMAGPLRDQCVAAIDSLAACPLFETRSIRDRWTALMARPDQVHWSRPLSLVVLGNYLAAARGRGSG